MKLDEQKTKEVSQRFEAMDRFEAANAVLRWSSGTFGEKISLATGFGVEGCVIMHLIGTLELPIDIFTLDTGLLFDETYELWKKLEAQYGFKIRGITPDFSLEKQAEVFGAKLWQRDPNQCCRIRKVLPLQGALHDREAWITAIRRDQTPDRAQSQLVEPDKRFSLIKVNPLVRWTDADVWDIVKKNNIPYNPLHKQGYLSIGCQPCTTKVRAGEDARAGRWRGSSKTECGLHAQPSGGNSNP